MVEITTLLQVLQKDIKRVNETISQDIDELETVHDDQLIEILRYGLLGGGKRIRPLLTIICGRLCGYSADDIFKLATAFEYLHAATLFHDDVIDQANTRRGQPSVYKAYGLDAAILAGDFLHARSMEIIGTYGGVECLKIFCRATSTIANGEFLQLRNTKNYNQSEEDYLQTIEGKTALFISAATEIGAMVGSADKAQRFALAEYGRNLGYGFQIVDDLLDYQGNADKTGKATGNDLIEGKMTLPLILAIHQADNEDRQRLLTIVQDKKEREESFEEIYNLIEKYNGFQLTRKKAEYFIKEAIRNLQGFSNENENISILKALGEYVLAREK
ncbi:MAG: polyprenyl synthetase family protein [Desulfocapsaceae bacterium]|nr:polyprenyl synthetase family protein [Desulfocapsaceae bacterium]